MWAKQVMENNASETKFMLECVLYMIEEFVSSKDKTPLDITHKIYDDEGGEIPADKMTLGLVRNAIKKYHWTIRVNDRSGANPSNVLQQAQITRTLQFAQPGTPAFYKLSAQLANINDRDVSMEDFMVPQQPAPPQGGAPQEIEEGQEPSQTDRLKVDPRSSEPEPIY